ncbi:hypothetical protein ACO0K9_00630 [Undibacterium sp. Ji50W]|uniref:hypothetical protein n=1 Tax=Undibacterium sp. Ji50W TaxID=3413041 RepID=UPI003BF125C7
MRDNRVLTDLFSPDYFNNTDNNFFAHIIMARTINGIGTTFYGKCKFNADDSFITTKWVVLVFIPIVPLASYRFIEESSSSFEVVDADIPLEIMQVLRTWLFVALLVFGLNLAEKQKMSGAGLFLLFGMICAIPFVMRWFAKRNVDI